MGGTFEAHLAGGPDAAQQMIEDFRTMEAPEGIDKPTQEAITRRLGGRLRDARNRIMLQSMTAETEAIVERALTVTELSMGAGEGTAGHAEIEAAALSPEQKSRLAAEAEAWIAQEQKRLDGRVLMGRTLAGETDDTDTLDPNDPDSQAAVDDYFMNVVVPDALDWLDPHPRPAIPRRITGKENRDGPIRTAPAVRLGERSRPDGF